jgi:hypothetical protein
MTARLALLAIALLGAAVSGCGFGGDVGMVVEVTLRDGRWGGGDARGTYSVVGDRLVFDWPQEASSNTFTFERHANGDLDLEAVLPMDRGDQFNWASETWRRVGPPVRDIP